MHINQPNWTSSIPTFRNMIAQDGQYVRINLVHFNGKQRIDTFLHILRVEHRSCGAF